MDGLDTPLKVDAKIANALLVLPPRPSLFFHIDSEAAKHLLIRGLASSARPNFLFPQLRLETQLCLRHGILAFQVNPTLRMRRAGWSFH